MQIPQNVVIKNFVNSYNLFQQIFENINKDHVILEATLNKYFEIKNVVLKIW